MLFSNILPINESYAALGTGFILGRPDTKNIDQWIDIWLKLEREIEQNGEKPGRMNVGNLSHLAENAKYVPVENEDAYCITLETKDKKI